MTARIYVACLASYNNGVLHGEWIDASSDVDEMQEKVFAILHTSPYPNVTVTTNYKHPITDAILQITSPYTHIVGCDRQVPSSEEFAIHDFEGAMLAGLGEYVGLDVVASRMEIAELAEDDMGENGPELVLAYWEATGTMPTDPQEAVDAARDAYAGSGDTLRAWCEEFVQDTMFSSKDNPTLQQYFDYDAYVRDLQCSGAIFHTCIDGDVHVFWNR